MKKVNWKKAAIAIWVLVGGLVLIGLIAPRSGSPDFTKAMPYQVMTYGDFSFPGRTRLEWGITSSARSFEERAQTAMKAAFDLQKKSKADVVSIWLEIGPAMAGAGHQLAIARYAPDGGGFSGDQKWIWEVEAAVQEPDPLEIEVGELWYQNSEAYRGLDGALDEPSLKAFIAEKLGVEKEKVSLPWITRNVYPVL
jgi:hypothetical protein